MATMHELVVRHGLPIRIQCDRPGYPPFTIVGREGERTFRVRYDDGVEGYTCECDWFSDYYVVEPVANNREG